MSENKVIDGLIYSKELEQYVDIKEWLQHVMSLANSTQEWNFDLNGHHVLIQKVIIIMNHI